MGRALLLLPVLQEQDLLLVQPQLEVSTFGAMVVRNDALAEGLDTPICDDDKLSLRLQQALIMCFSQTTDCTTEVTVCAERNAGGLSLRGLPFFWPHPWAAEDLSPAVGCQHSPSC